MAIVNNWDNFGGEKLYSVQRGYKNFSDIPASCGFISANNLVTLANSMLGISISKKNDINFSIVGIMFGNNGGATKITLLNDESIVKNSTAAQCAEHKMWSVIGSKHQIGMHLAVNQHTGPCEQCMDKYRGVAKTKQCDIILDYHHYYGSLPNNGRLMFSSTGTILLSAGTNSDWVPR